MSISTLESLDSVRMLREIDRMTEQRIRNEIGYMQEFTQEVMTKPMTADSKLETRLVWTQNLNTSPRRPATVCEVMADTLDYSDGPQLSDALAIIVRVAREGDIEAQRLIARMASTFAKYREEA